MKLVKVLILEDSHIVIRRLKSKNINIYNIEKGNIYVISEKDIDNIPFELEILSYKGIKGILSKIKLNKEFIISVILSILIMFLLSNMVFDVEVIHSSKNLRKMLLEELSNNGIHPFIFKKSFDEKETIKKKIKEDHKDEIEWLEIIDEGMKYIVRVEERIINSEKEDKKYCDVVSKKDAMILDGSVIKGQQVTFRGDYVKKDSTLIRGAIMVNDVNKNYVCANGVIYGNTWYTINISVPYEYEIKNYTGKVKKNLSFLNGSKRTQIFKTHIDKYDVDLNEIFRLGDIVFYREVDKEYKSVLKKYSLEEAKDIALKSARKKILTNLDANSQILYEKVLQTHEFDSIIEMEIFYSVKEPISKVVEKDIPEDIKGE